MLSSDQAEYSSIMEAVPNKQAMTYKAVIITHLPKRPLPAPENPPLDCPLAEGGSKRGLPKPIMPDDGGLLLLGAAEKPSEAAVLPKPRMRPCTFGGLQRSIVPCPFYSLCIPMNVGTPSSRSSMD